MILNKPANFIPKEHSACILQQGKIPSKLLLVKEGEIYGGNSTGRYVYFTLKKGSYFGEGYILTQKPCSYSINYFRKEGASLFCVENIDLIRICQSYPSSFEKIRRRSISRRRVFRKMKYNVLREIISETLQKSYNFGEDSVVNLNSIRTEMYNELLKTISLKETILIHEYLQDAKNDIDNDDQESNISGASLARFQDNSSSVSQETSRKFELAESVPSKISLKNLEKSDCLNKEENKAQKMRSGDKTELINYQNSGAPLIKFNIYEDGSNIFDESSSEEESITSKARQILSRNNKISSASNNNYTMKSGQSDSVKLGFDRNQQVFRKIDSINTTHVKVTSSFK